MKVDDPSEDLRVRYKYRELIMKKKIRLPVAVAARLIGPDCAYHLYSTLGRINKESES
jgi:hypothetical protein